MRMCRKGNVMQLNVYNIMWSELTLLKLMDICFIKGNIDYFMVQKILSET